MRLRTSFRRAGGGDVALGALLAVAAVAVATAAALFLAQGGRLPNLAMVFVPAILLTAVVSGLAASLVASALSLLSYNFFFMAPLNAFGIGGVEDVLTLLIFLAVAVCVSELAARLRLQAASAREREARTKALYELGRAISGTDRLEELAPALAAQIARGLAAPVAVWLAEPDGEPRLLATTDTSLADQGLAAARAACAGGEDAVATADGLLACRMAAPRGTVGAIVAARSPAESSHREIEARRVLLRALADQSAVAIERVRLAAEIEAARRLAETERFRSALLNSVSHDLRTPLASIIGSATTLATPGPAISDPARRDLLATIQEEAFRLDRFVNNLLDMTRLESGVLAPNLDWTDPADVIGVALRRLRRPEGLRLETRLAPDLPLLFLDPVLTEHAVANLLDNAVKHSPPGGTIRVTAQRRRDVCAGADAVAVVVEDQGPGVPEAERAQIFEKFRRAEAGDRRRAGIGLGLSICRGFVEAQGGRVAVAASPLGGARFEIAFPVPAGARAGDALTTDALAADALAAAEPADAAGR